MKHYEFRVVPITGSAANIYNIQYRRKCLINILPWKYLRKTVVSCWSWFSHSKIAEYTTFNSAVKDVKWYNEDPEKRLSDLKKTNDIMWKDALMEYKKRKESRKTIYV